MNRRAVLVGLLALPGCATMTAVGEATGVLNTDGSVNLYGIVKGVADAAMIADPGLGLIVSAALAVTEPLLARVTAGDATAAHALIAHSNALLVAVAPAVTVNPNTTRGA